MASFKTPGIILKIQPSGEADFFVTVYTLKYGKQKLFAKGVRKQESKMGPFIKLMAEVDLMFIKGRSLNKLAGIENKTIFDAKKEKITARYLWKLGLGEYCLEAADKMIQEDNPDEEIYRLIGGYLKYNFCLEVSPKKAYFISKIFTIKLLDQLGYKLNLSSCVRCRKKIDFKGNGRYFHFLKNGLIHQDCIIEQDGECVERYQQDIVRFLKFSQNSQLADLFRIKPSDRQLSLISCLADGLLKGHLEKEIKTLKWLASLINPIKADD